MRDELITCDSCGRDLTTTSNGIDYRLSLQSERVPCQSGMVTDMMIYPPIDRPAHFCHTGCLCQWVDQTLRSQHPAKWIGNPANREEATEMIRKGQMWRASNGEPLKPENTNG